MHVMTMVLLAVSVAGADAAGNSIHARGALGSVTDLDYPEGFPVAAKTDGGSTRFPLRLEPGEATIIRLQP